MILTGGIRYQLIMMIIQSAHIKIDIGLQQNTINREVLSFYMMLASRQHIARRNICWGSRLFLGSTYKNSVVLGLFGSTGLFHLHLIYRKDTDLCHLL
jgi:hypothetical protein